MILTPDNIKSLSRLGYADEDIPQIAAVAKIIIVYVFPSGDAVSGRRVAWDHAMRLLGSDGFLSGLGRAAFHRTACKDIADDKAKENGLHEGAYVYFNAIRFFQPKKNGRYGRH